MGRLPSLRMLTLWLLSLSIVSTLGRLFLLPPVQIHSGPLSPKEFTFPDQVKLTGWKALSSSPTHANQVNVIAQPKFLAGHSYQYQQRDIVLSIDMVYAIETNGNLVNFLDNYTSVNPSIVRSPESLQRFDSRTGHYLLFVSGQSVYLSSCINPRGRSTITLDQFHQNRYMNDFRPERLFRWFFLSESMRDLRCLWNKLSIPLGIEHPEQAFSILEDVWLTWHGWWQDNFPEL